VFGKPNESSKNKPDTITSSPFSKKPEFSNDNNQNIITSIATNKQSGSIFGNSMKPKLDEEKKLEDKNKSDNVLFKPQGSSGIFSGNKSSNIFAKISDSKPKAEPEAKPINTFNKSQDNTSKQVENEPKEDKTEAKKIGLFGRNIDTSKATTAALFAKSSDQSKQEDLLNQTESTKSAETKKFPSKPLFSSGSSTGIFGKKTDQKPADKQTPTEEKSEDQKDDKPKYKSLFGTKSKQESEEKEKTSLFKANASGPLFGGTKSLFGSSNISKPEDQKQSFIKSGGDNNDKPEEEEEEPKEDDKPKFKAVSKDPYIKIYNRNVEKFRVAKHDKGNGILSIETGETNGKRFVLFNFRNPIGKTLFTGQILQQ